MSSARALAVHWLCTGCAGDLKPSNVMTLRPHAAETGPRLSTGVCFIDFELAGAHYRG